MARLKIEIKNSDDLNDVLSDMLSDFCENMTEIEGMTYPAELSLVTYEEGISFWYTDKAMQLIQRWHNRMKQVFVKYFPEEDFNPKSTYYKEI